MDGIPIGGLCKSVFECSHMYLDSCSLPCCVPVNSALTVCPTVSQLKPWWFKQSTLIPCISALIYICLEASCPLGRQ